MKRIRIKNTPQNSEDQDQPAILDTPEIPPEASTAPPAPAPIPPVLPPPAQVGLVVPPLPSGAVPIDEKEKGLMELAKQKAVLEEQKAEVSADVSKAKWDALSNAEARAATLRAELAEIESKMAAHQHDLQAKAQAENRVRIREKNKAELQEIAVRSATRLQVASKQLQGMASCVGSLKLLLVHFLVSAREQEKDSFRFTELYANTPDSVVVEKEIQEESGVSLAPARTRIQKGFDSPTFNRKNTTVSGNLYGKLLKEFDPVLIPLLEFLLTHDRESIEEAIRKELGEFYRLDDWLPPVSRKEPAFPQLLIRS